MVGKFLGTSGDGGSYSNNNNGDVIKNLIQGTIKTTTI